MRSLNLTQLIGNLTKVPELKQTANGNSVATFTLAMNRPVKNGEQWDEATDFVDCVTWGKQAEVIQANVTKGQKLYVQGRIQTRSWQHEGTTKYKTEVIVTDFVFLDKSGQPTNVNSKDVVLEDIDDKPIDLSSIPF